MLVLRLNVAEKLDGRISLLSLCLPSIHRMTSLFFGCCDFQLYWHVYLYWGGENSFIVSYFNLLLSGMVQ